MNYIEFNTLNPEAFHNYVPPIKSEAFNGQIPYPTEAFNGEVLGKVESKIDLNKVLTSIAVVGGIILVGYISYTIYQKSQEDKQTIRYNYI